MTLGPTSTSVQKSKKGGVLNASKPYSSSSNKSGARVVIGEVDRKSDDFVFRSKDGNNVKIANSNDHSNYIGFAVGTEESASLGEGASLGLADGDDDGSDVGFVVGGIEGEEVGFKDGSIEDNEVGFVVGTKVGFVVGTKLGSLVGTKVGLVVGGNDGETVKRWNYRRRRTRFRC